MSCSSENYGEAKVTPGGGGGGTCPDFGYQVGMCPGRIKKYIHNPGKIFH